MNCSAPTRQTAKKNHRCSWCGEDILPGTVYVRWRCYEDNEAGTTKLHPECDAASAEHLRRSSDWEVEMFGEAPRGGVDEPFDVATYEQALALHEEGALV